MWLGKVVSGNNGSSLEMRLYWQIPGAVYCFHFGVAACVVIINSLFFYATFFT